jgi:hypothetical protein
LFELPTVRGLAKEIEERKGAGLWLKAPPIERVVRRENLPLSYAQQGLWFLEQMEPGSGIYNIPGALVLSGDVNVAVLEQAITEVVRRHEALRTTFSSQDGHPLQVIGEPTMTVLPIIDLSAISERQESEARRLVLKEARRAFDLSQGPLLRSKLIRLSDREYVMTFTAHHIATDGWSMGVLVRELTALYEAYSKGSISPIAELKTQYADYAYWQRKWMTGAVLEEGLRYWKRELNGELPVLDLGGKRPKPEVASYQGANQAYVMPVEIKEGIKSLSREEGATIYMTLLAAFGIFLHRYSGQEEMIIGTAVAGRARPETEGLIGVFINMLPIRVDLQGSPSYREALSRVREVILRGYAYQEVPIENIIDELKVERQARQAPLFQVAFGVQNLPEEDTQLPNLELRPFSLDHDVARYDLTVWVEETAEGLRISWTYRTDIYDVVMITRMHKHFERLLLSIIKQPDMRINLIEMMTEAEKEQQAQADKEWEDLSASRLKTIGRKPIKAVF